MKSHSITLQRLILVLSLGLCIASGLPQCGAEAAGMALEPVLTPLQAIPSPTAVEIPTNHTLVYTDLSTAFPLRTAKVYAGNADYVLSWEQPAENRRSLSCLKDGATIRVLGIRRWTSVLRLPPRLAKELNCFCQ